MSPLCHLFVTKTREVFTDGLILKGFMTEVTFSVTFPPKARFPVRRSLGEGRRKLCPDTYGHLRTPTDTYGHHKLFSAAALFRDSILDPQSGILGKTLTVFPKLLHFCAVSGTKIAFPSNSGLCSAPLRLCGNRDFGLSVECFALQNCSISAPFLVRKSHFRGMPACALVL